MVTVEARGPERIICQLTDCGAVVVRSRVLLIYRRHPGLRNEVGTATTAGLHHSASVSLRSYAGCHTRGVTFEAIVPIRTLDGTAWARRRQEVGCTWLLPSTVRYRPGVPIRPDPLWVILVARGLRMSQHEHERRSVVRRPMPTLSQHSAKSEGFFHLIFVPLRNAGCRTPKICTVRVLSKIALLTLLEVCRWSSRGGQSRIRHLSVK